MNGLAIFWLILALLTLGAIRIAVTHGVDEALIEGAFYLALCWLAYRQYKIWFTKG
jgi:hypothetical protein